MITSEHDNMARSRRKKVGPIRKWWRSNRQIHFGFYTLSTIFFTSLILFSLIFVFFMDGVQNLQSEGRENLIPLVWIALLGGAVALFFVAPEFFFFMGQKQLLEDILNLDSRPEVLRRKKEAENAADALGKKYQARLKGLYEMLGINIGKKYSMPSIHPNRNVNKSSESEQEEE
ncbi:MAG: hypothetical protein CL993_02765 [Euryarchaeota archaeon]|nr:hypothetical protein [Euryarchaeota archaeon]